MRFPILDPDGRFERLARDYDQALLHGEHDIARRILAAHAAGMIEAEHRDARWDGANLAANEQGPALPCGCDLCDAGVAL